MFGATQEQQDDVARAAKAAGGYLELVEQLRSTPATPASADETVTYTIDPKTRQVRLASR